MTPVLLLDYVGVALFAITGALTASRKQLDIIGFLFLAGVTGLGGGTVRDLILDVAVFWVVQPVYVLICIVCGICVYFGAHLIESRYRLLLWLDAAALSAYGVFGAYKGLLVTQSQMVAVIMGMMTATLGGILRDVLSQEPSVIMRQDIYLAAALTGAVVFVVAGALDIGVSWAAGAGFLLAFGVRSGALLFGWTLPLYKSRPGRRPNDRA